jgi:hypothetical protein
MIFPAIAVYSPRDDSIVIIGDTDSVRMPADDALQLAHAIVAAFDTRQLGRSMAAESVPA